MTFAEENYPTGNTGKEKLPSCASQENIWVCLGITCIRLVYVICEKKKQVQQKQPFVSLRCFWQFWRWSDLTYFRTPQKKKETRGLSFVFFAVLLAIKCDLPISFCFCFLSLPNVDVLDLCSGCFFLAFLHVASWTPVPLGVEPCARGLLPFRNFAWDFNVTSDYQLKVQSGQSDWQVTQKCAWKE